MRLTSRRDRPRRGALAAAVAFAAVLAALFVWLGNSLPSQRVAGLDHSWQEALFGARHPAADAAARAFDAAGSTVGFAVLTVLFALFFLLAGRRRNALLTVVATAAAWGLNSAAKAWFERPRPEVEALVAADGFSFPSGNATIGIAFAGFAAIALSSWMQTRTARSITAAVAVIFILLLGISRIYAGVHYPTDILGGFLLGGACLLVLAALRDTRSRV